MCVGDGCTGGDYALMFLSILVTICCCLCCHKLRGNGDEDDQTTDINLAEVLNRQEEEEVKGSPKIYQTFILALPKWFVALLQ